MSVVVRSYAGESLSISTHTGLSQLCEAAARAELPMLGRVDPYDDTTFNRLQVGFVISELSELLPALRAEVADVAREVLGLAERASAKPHQYLVFSGD